MKTITVSILVHVPDKTKPNAVAKMIDRLIDIGLDDATETLKQGEGDLKSIEQLRDWSIQKSQVVK